MQTTKRTKTKVAPGTAARVLSAQERQQLSGLMELLGEERVAEALQLHRATLYKLAAGLRARPASVFLASAKLRELAAAVHA